MRTVTEVHTSSLTGSPLLLETRKSLQQNRKIAFGLNLPCHIPGFKASTTPPGQVTGVTLFRPGRWASIPFEAYESTRFKPSRTAAGRAIDRHRPGSPCTRRSCARIGREQTHGQAL